MPRTAALLLMLFTLAVLAPIAGAQDADADVAAELERLRAENAALKQRVAELEAKIAKLEDREQDLETQKEQLEQLAGVTTTGQRVESQRANITSDYNDDEDKTVVRTKPNKLSLTHGSRADHYLSLAYSYPGEKREGEPEHVTLFIQSMASGGAYNADTRLELTLGEDQAITVEPSSYDRDRQRRSRGSRTLSRHDDETLVYLLSWAQLEALAGANEVTGRVGPTRFTLTADQIAAFKALVTRVELGV